MGIGDNAVIENAILDKNCRIGRGVSIRSTGEEEATHDPIVIRDGIAIVPRAASVPDDWRM